MAVPGLCIWGSVPTTALVTTRTTGHGISAEVQVLSALGGVRPGQVHRAHACHLASCSRGSWTQTQGPTNLNQRSWWFVRATGCELVQLLP